MSPLNKRNDAPWLAEIDALKAEVERLNQLDQLRCTTIHTLREALEDLMKSYGSGTPSCGHAFACTCVWDKARAALKRQEGGE